MCNILSVILHHDLKNHESWSKMSLYHNYFHLFDTAVYYVPLQQYYLLGVFWSIEGSNGHITSTQRGQVGATTKQQQQQSNNKNCNFFVSWWKQIPEGTNLNSRQRVALSSLTVSTSVPDSKTQWYVLTYLTDCQLHLSFEVFEAVYFSVNLVQDFWR